MKRLICAILLFLSFIPSAFIFNTPLYAQEDTTPRFANLVFTVYGSTNAAEISQLRTKTQQVLDTIHSYNLPATILLTPTALADKQLVSLLITHPALIEIGLFLDVTPELLGQTIFNNGKQITWEPRFRMISSYEAEDRPFILNTSMNEFGLIFGHFPPIIASWHVDSISAKFLSEKYGVKGIILPSEQTSNSIARLWGQWLGRPYFPSTNNVLLPAQKPSDKVPIVIIPWDQPDPFLYVSDPPSSQPRTSLEIADSYLQINSHYGYATLHYAITGDMLQQLPLILQELQQLLEYLDQHPNIQTITSSQFVDWYQQTYPDLSPEEVLTFTLPNQDHMIWELTRQSRSGTYSSAMFSQIIDFRTYSLHFPEPYLVQINPFNEIQFAVPAQIDGALASSNQTDIVIHDSAELPFDTDVLLIISLWIVIALLFWIQVSDLMAGGAIIIGSGIWMLTMVKNGLWNPFGIGFWGPHGHDAIWHLAVSQPISQGHGLQNPILSGEQLSNYHFFFNFILAGVHALTRIPLANLYFQILPFIISLLIGLGAYRLATRLTHNRRISRIIVLLTYTAGSAGWLVNGIRYGHLYGETMFWAQQSISTLVNPPYALSLAILLFGLVALVDFLQLGTKVQGILAVLLLSLLAQTKVYASVLLILGLWITIGIQVWRLLPHLRTLLTTKKHWQSLVKKHPEFFRLVIVSFVISVLSVLITVPFAKNTDGVFVWNPLWFVHSMIASHDRINWPALDQARTTYQYTNIFKFILAEIGAISIFLLGNLWTRIIGLIFIFQLFYKRIKHQQKLTTIDTLFISMMVISFTIPLLFTQRGTVWNTIQFMYYGLFIAVFYTARAIGSMKLSRQLALFITAIIIFLNIPTTMGTLSQYLPARPPARIPAEELAALDFLRQLPLGTVLSAPYQSEYARNLDVPYPLAAYTSTAYISAYSGQPSTYADQVNLEIIGVDWEPKLEIINNLFSANKPALAKQYLDQLHVDYLYLLKGQTLEVEPSSLGFEKIYDNGLVRIFIIPH